MKTNIVMETKTLSKFNFVIILLLFPTASFAGRINNVFFDGSIITIHHHDCQLGQHIQDKRRHEKKLILPMNNCASKKGVINVAHPNLKKIHWAQHDRKTVWIVATFAKDYQFDIISSPNKFQVCLPVCYQRNPFKHGSSHFKKKANNLMFSRNGILFQIPLQGMLIDDFLKRSIGFKPRNLIRDGLPHFGAKRDDWKGKTRRHLGYDIYVDNRNVVAAAQGIVTRIKKTRRSGLYIKLHHGSKLYTLYVHLKSVSVRKGLRVKRGDIIGTINGPAGNAIAPQLHFELKPNNKSINPLPLIERFYQDDSQVIKKIRDYKSSLQMNIQKRNRKVRQFLFKMK